MRATSKPSPKAYPRTVRELIDQDYGEKLSPADRAWLDRFNDEFYGAAFRPDSLHATKEQRQELYNTKNHRNEDVYGRCVRAAGSGGAGDGIGDAGDEDDRDWGPRALYEQTPEYKAALFAYRATLSRNNKENTRITPEFIASKQVLEGVTGVKTSTHGEGAEPAPSRMAQSRIEKYVETRKIIMFLGKTVSEHQFTGAEAEAAVAMLTWLEAYLEKLNGKLVSLGWTEGGANGS